LTKKAVIACALAAFLGIGATLSIAQGAEQEGARAMDIIGSRRVLMTMIGRNMDEINAMLEVGGKLDGREAGEHADTIAAMLSVFPHLFPPGTNIWSEKLQGEDPARVTLALPNVWNNYDQFYHQAQLSADIALKAAYSKNAQEFRTRAGELQAACDSCHAQFRREQQPKFVPIPPK